MKRSDCKNGYRPCPKVSCRYHLLCDVDSTGRIQGFKRSVERFEDYEKRVLDYLSDENNPTCSLDLADNGEHTILEISELTGIHIAKVREILATAIRKIGSNERLRNLSKRI